MTKAGCGKLGEFARRGAVSYFRHYSIISLVVGSNSTDSTDSTGKEKVADREIVYT